MNSFHIKFKNRQNKPIVTEVRTVVTFGKGTLAGKGIKEPWRVLEGVGNT